MLETIVKTVLEYTIETLKLPPKALIIITALTCVIFRRPLLIIANEKLRLFRRTVKPKTKPIIDAFSDDVKIVVEFGEHLVIPDQDEFASALGKLIHDCRASSRLLVLNFVSLTDVNECAREAIRAAIKTAIEENNIRMLLIFPGEANSKNPDSIKRITLLCDDLAEFSKMYSDRSVKIKKDERRSDFR